MKYVIIIPTYNESRNVPLLVPKLSEQINKIKNHEVQVLFVDDSSPDGTADVIERLRTEFTFVNLIVRKEKNGLGAAYVAGYKHAIENMHADVIMEMDADLQHNPEDIYKFVGKIDEGFDFVVGSRYILPDGIPQEWELRRKLLSWGGNVFIRYILGIFEIHEFTNNFRATRVKNVLDQIYTEELLSYGFAYKIHMIYLLHRAGAKLSEIPVRFGLREEGISKMEQNNMLDSLRVVLTLRLREFKSFIKFVLVGFVGLFIDTLIFNIARLTILSSGMAGALSGLFGMITTFTLNNAWAFKHKRKETLAEELKCVPS